MPRKGVSQIFNLLYEATKNELKNINLHLNLFCDFNIFSECLILKENMNLIKDLEPIIQRTKPSKAEKCIHRYVINIFVSA